MFFTFSVSNPLFGLICTNKVHLPHAHQMVLKVGLDIFHIIFRKGFPQGSAGWAKVLWVSFDNKIRRCCANRCCNKHLESFLMTTNMRRFKTTSSIELVVCSIRFACTVVKWTDEVVFIIKEWSTLFTSDLQYRLMEEIQSLNRKVPGSHRSLNSIVWKYAKICYLYFFFENNHIPKIEGKLSCIYV